MSKTFNKNISIVYNTGASLQLSSNTNTIGNLFTTGGNVGIGTTAPNNVLDIVVNGDGSLGMGINNSNTGANSRINMNMNVGFGTSGNAGQIYASTGDPTFTIRSYSANTSGISLLTGGAAPIKFLTQGTERMRIATSGNVGIGTTNPAHTLHVNGNIVSSNALILYSVTPFAVEAQWTTYTESTMNISANIPADAKAVLADVFLTNTVSDHLVITLGSEYAGNVQTWANTRGAQPSTYLAAVTKRVNRYAIAGELDNYSSNFGLWYPSQTIYISTDRRIYWSNGGYSSGSGWVYVNIKGYYL